MATHKVLSTKKLDPSLIEQAEQNGIEIIEQEAIRVNPILSKEKWQEIFQLLESNKEFAVFTSSNAVSAVKKYLNEYVIPVQPNWKIFALSGKTRQALEENLDTFGRIVATANDSKELANKIAEAKVKEVIFFCGNKRRDELPSILEGSGIKVHEVIVYETLETPKASKGDYDAVLFFSPSAVKSFFSLNQLKKDVVCFAIGQTTADSIAATSGSKIIIAKTPAQEALLEEVINYFKSVVNQG
jgi:uroporphyrinogen-III synthase